MYAKAWLGRRATRYALEMNVIDKDNVISAKLRIPDTVITNSNQSCISFHQYLFDRQLVLAAP
jgi:hypothetical protein